MAELPEEDPVPVADLPVFVDPPDPEPLVGADDGVKTAVGFAMQELTTAVAEAVEAAAFTVPLPLKLQSACVRPCSS